MTKKVIETDEDIKRDALSYKSTLSWRLGSEKSYKAAVRRGKEFFDSCTTHMNDKKTDNGSKKIIKKLIEKNKKDSNSKDIGQKLEINPSEVKRPRGRPRKVKFNDLTKEDLNYTDRLLVKINNIIVENRKSLSEVKDVFKDIDVIRKILSQIRDDVDFLRLKIEDMDYKKSTSKKHKKD